jgi:hypothetical protein
MSKLKPETVQLWGRESQDLEISSERAAVIAKFVSDVGAKVMQAAEAMSFDAAPADFLRTLQRWRDRSHESR